MTAIIYNHCTVIGKLVHTAEVCRPRRALTIGDSGLRRAEAFSGGSFLGQITACLTNIVGEFRPMV